MFELYSKEAKMNSKEFEYLGINKFHDLGYKGKGIVIASREKETTSHGSKVADILKQVCPEADILYSIDYKKDTADFDIYTTSLSFASDSLAVSENKAKELVEQNKFLVCAVGNESEDSATAISKNKYFKSIGACHLINEKAKRATYSSITDDIDYMCLSNLENTLSNKRLQGTSFAAPLFAGMLALYQCYMLQKIGRKLTYSELEEFVNNNLIDLEEEGFDSKTGNGLFILPEIEEEKMKIKLKIGSKIAVVNGREVEMDVAPLILENRTFVPVRFVSEVLGFQVNWNEKDREVTIEK